ncbi:MAG: ABC transporter substrate-binding protein [Hylemonella sp.]|nr:ABC transporter substrate-binding protein [Hylemonella sp.]
MQRRFFHRLLSASAAAAILLAPFFTPAWAADEGADVVILKLSNEVLDSIKADAAIKSGDINRLIALVDSKIMPNVNFQRMTAASVGPGWRQATPEQKKRLQEEYKILLVRTYAGALSQVNDMTVSLKPMRAAPEGNEVVVRTEVRGRGNPEPVQLEYRVEKTPGEGLGWKIYDLNVMGVWLVSNYRGQFAQEVNAKGIDGLIAALVERNRVNAKKA